MNNTNLFVLFLLLTRWITSIHGQQALDWTILSCTLFYDRNNPTDNTDNTNVCVIVPVMPCNCLDPQWYKDPLSDGSAANTLHLTDNSYLDYTIKLTRPNDEFWQLSKLEFVYGPNVDVPLNTTSQVFIYDINDQVFHEISWFHTYSLTLNINTLIMNPAANIAQYTAWMIRFNLKWTLTGAGIVEPAYITVEGTDVTKQPTTDPSKSPSKFPTTSPSNNPTKFPSKSPSG
eukprot:444574_1